MRPASNCHQRDKYFIAKSHTETKLAITGLNLLFLTSFIPNFELDLFVKLNKSSGIR
jgi:hypothetical protein